jgi:chromosome segregation ATPase
MKTLWALTALAAGLGFVAGIVMMNWIDRQEMQDAIDDAAKHQTRREAIADQAKVLDIDAERFENVSQGYAREVFRLREKLNATQARLANVTRPIPADGKPQIEMLERQVQEVSALVTDQKALIQAQDASIQGLQAQVISLTAARDAWKRSSDEGAREALNLRAALAQQQGLAKSALWRGRIQGFALGIVAGGSGGYVAGRF